MILENINEKGLVKSDQVAFNSEGGKTVSYPVLKTAYNQELKVDYTRHFFGEVGQTKHAKGELIVSDSNAELDYSEFDEQAALEGVSTKEIVAGIFKRGAYIVQTVGKSGKEEITEKASLEIDEVIGENTRRSKKKK